MKVRVQFFASIREAIGQESIEVELSGVSLVSDVVATLSEQKPEWVDILTDPKVLVAVNQEMTHSGCKVEEGDEIAFFPPVTGG